MLDTHQSVLPSDNLRALLAACSNTIRTADVIFTNWNKGKICASATLLSLIVDRNKIAYVCLSSVLIIGTTDSFE